MAIESGYMQDQIAASAYKYQKDIESGEKIIVGVNKFQSEDKKRIPGFRIDESIQKLQSDKIKLLKQRRDTKKAEASLAILEATVRSTENLMPAVLDAVENYCTLGEVADILRKVFGEYKG